MGDKMAVNCVQMYCQFSVFCPIVFTVLNLNISEMLFLPKIMIFLLESTETVQIYKYFGELKYIICIQKFVKKNPTYFFFLIIIP